MTIFQLATLLLGRHMHRAQKGKFRGISLSSAAGSSLLFAEALAYVFLDRIDHLLPRGNQGVRARNDIDIEINLVDPASGDSSSFSNSATAISLSASAGPRWSVPPRRLVAIVR